MFYRVDYMLAVMFAGFLIGILCGSNSKYATFATCAWLLCGCRYLPGSANRSVYWCHANEFPSPEVLWEKHRAWKGLTPEAEKIVLQDYYDDASDKSPRYYQTNAVNATVEAIAKGQDRVLLVMATGTGKTYTAFQTIWKLWKSGRKKRMHRTYKVGILHERVSKNPLLPVETRSKSNYRAIVITPAQTLAILEKLINPLHFALTLTCAATALRASEILALRWDDVLWNEGRIRISKRWAKGADGETKTEASDGYVPMHPLLSCHMQDWHQLAPHAKGKDFVFPSLTAEGKVPLNACSFVKDHLRVAAKASGVQIADGQRFGLHNLRHSLSNWLVNKGKVEPKTVQGLLRHSKIQTTLDLYTQEDSDETRAAQGAFLNAVGLQDRTIQ